MNVRIEIATEGQPGWDEQWALLGQLLYMAKVCGVKEVSIFVKELSSNDQNQPSPGEGENLTGIAIAVAALTVFVATMVKLILETVKSMLPPSYYMVLLIGFVSVGAGLSWFLVWRLIRRKSSEEGDSHECHETD